MHRAVAAHNLNEHSSRSCARRAPACHGARPALLLRLGQPKAGGLAGGHMAVVVPTCMWLLPQAWDELHEVVRSITGTLLRLAPAHRAGALQARDLHAAAGAAAQADRVVVAQQPPLPALQAAPGGPGRRAPCPPLPGVAACARAPPLCHTRPGSGAAVAWRMRAEQAGWSACRRWGTVLRAGASAPRRQRAREGDGHVWAAVQRGRADQ